MWLETYFRPRVFLMLFLGFSSGLPLALTASTLTAWLSEAGVTKTSIGLFASVTAPYALKFLWSPLMDGTKFPILGALLGRRRGWLLATQIALVLAILGLAMADPSVNAWNTAFFALLVAIASASQDIVIDAYRVEVLPKEDFGPGVAMATLGYRIGMLVSGAGALYLATYTDWKTTYVIMSAMMGVGMLAVLISPEPENQAIPPERPGLTAWIRASVIAPFTDFATRPGWFEILLFIALFKLGDAFLGIMTNPFLLEIGFQKTDIADVVKIYGFAATIIGTFIGGSLAQRYGTYAPLWISGVLHAVTNLMFLAQAHVGADKMVLALGITLENLTGGISAAVFVVFISGLCRVQYTATQYALLSSLAVLGRTTLSSAAGWCAEVMGWEWFFILCVLLAAPGLLLLVKIQRDANKIASPA